MDSPMKSLFFFFLGALFYFLIRAVYKKVAARRSDIKKIQLRHDVEFYTADQIWSDEEKEKLSA